MIFLSFANLISIEFISTYNRSIIHVSLDITQRDKKSLLIGGEEGNVENVENLRNMRTNMQMREQENMRTREYGNKETKAYGNHRNIGTRKHGWTR